MNLINISSGVFIHILFVIACVLITIIMIFLINVIENFISIIKSIICWRKMKPNTQYITSYNYYDEPSDIYTTHIINIKNIDGSIIDCNITKITYWDENDNDISTWDESDHWYKIITKYELYDGTIKNM